MGALSPDEFERAERSTDPENASPLHRGALALSWRVRALTIDLDPIRTYPRFQLSVAGAARQQQI